MQAEDCQVFKGHISHKLICHCKDRRAEKKWSRGRSNENGRSLQGGLRGEKRGDLPLKSAQSMRE